MTTVNVWAGINAEDEFMLVSSIVFDNKFITQIGLSIMLVPVKLPHAVAFDPIWTYAGSLIRIFPLGLNASLIMIENVYDVIISFIPRDRDQKSPTAKIIGHFVNLYREI